MAILFRWVFRLTLLGFFLSALAVSLIYYFASRSLPEYDRTVIIDGLPSTIEIVRDNANVPHIFGENDRDVFFGLGYVHAQDRLWQMMMHRRTAQGRLSELFGRETLQIDMLMRRLDVHRLSRQSFDALDAETRTLLQAYSEGVNTRIAEINQGAKGRGAPEFFMFSNAIAPWQPADSIAVIKLMGIQLSSHLQDEVLRARASLLLSDARLKDILPDVPGAGTNSIPPFASLFEDVPKFAASTPMPDHPLSPFKAKPLAGASNAWAAEASRSAAGGTLLANDPHLGLSAPSIWYLARMELESGGVIGGTIPGLPVVLTGRSDQMGWGMTSAYVDDQDVFVEKLNPDNTNQYQTPQGWKTFQSRQSIVTIKDEAPVTLSLLWTDNGPVLPGSHFNLGTITPAGHVMSLSWTLLSPRDTSIEAAINLMQAQNIDQALKATEKFIAPAQNITMADRTEVALKTVGALPIRDEAHQSKGRLPSPGWISTNRWQGVFDQSVNPMFRGPAGGILGNTNNKVVDRPFPRHVSFTYGDTERVQRWQRLMQTRKVHTRDSFIEAQLDTVSPTARTMLPLIGQDLWYETQAADPGTNLHRRQVALDLLAQWNGEMNEHLPEPLIYAAWVRHLQQRLIQDELGPLADEFTHVEPLFLERVFRDIDGASVWCDVLQSAITESCVDISRVALDDALIWLGEKYGGTVESLRWGDAHEATHDHPVLGGQPVLNWFVNIRQSTSGGDNTLLRGYTSGDDENPFQNVHSAGYRGVYDFGDPDSSLFIISTGQSGHPLSRYYDDMGVLWRRGEYIPMSLDPSLARAGSIGTTFLSPVPENP